MPALDLHTAVANLVEKLKLLLLKQQVLDITERIEELELRQLGTEILEDTLGYQIE